MDGRVVELEAEVEKLRATAERLNAKLADALELVEKLRAELATLRAQQLCPVCHGTGCDSCPVVTS